MTTSPNSGSEAATQQAQAFHALHPRVQRWVWDQHWNQLRDAQAHAVAPILAANTDVIIAAATASGKTEAAWLPICSALAADNAAGNARPGVKALYLSPLKALINDQHSRLGQLCDYVDVPVHRWHGDVAGSRKKALTARPDGLLLITPESLEALFVTRGPHVPAIFAGLRYVVVDEMHSFIGTERGAQLQALLHRVELAVRRRIPRIALSATLGEPDAAAWFLRPGCGDQVRIITSDGDAGGLRMQLRGYIAADPVTEAAAHAVAGDDTAADCDALHSLDKTAIAEHLFRHLRGDDNLVFANSRSAVEAYADLLGRISAQMRVPNEFLPHHGNLSKEIREDVEARMKSAERPTTAVCTSTLEMGIDIGSVDSVAQIGASGSVAALRQRLGRSGRRGQPATLRMYVSERELTERTPPADQLRSQLMQTIAMVELLLHDKWYEAPVLENLHLSTLIQQILSVVAQHSGVTAAQLYSVLCGHGPFARVDRTTFAELLRCLGEEGLLTQGSDGLLLHGGRGEKMVNHHTFYAAFASADEYRLVAHGRTLGSLPVDYPILVGSLLIFSGRRWKVLEIDTSSKVIELARASGGRPPGFSGTGAEVADKVRQRMRQLYENGTVPRYLDRTAQRLLDEARDAYRRLGLATHPILGWGTDTLLFPWRGDRIMNTLAAVLTEAGLEVGQEGVALTVRGTSANELAALVADLAAGPMPDPVNLAGQVSAKEHDKYDGFLTDPLLDRAYAARAFDIASAWQTLDQLAAAPPPDPAPILDDFPSLAPLHTATVATVELGRTPFAVVDLETTGFAPHRDDRVVEVAVVHVDADGAIEQTWSTLINPRRSVGAAQVHGLTDPAVAAAPTFPQILDILAHLLSDRIVVAHNLPFDLAFLNSEFARAGVEAPRWPTLCTMDLADRLADTDARRLADCAHHEGIDIEDAHTATGDATATARLLGSYLVRARRRGITTLQELGCENVHLPPVWPTPTSPEPTYARRPHAPVGRPAEAMLAGLTARSVAGSSLGLHINAYLDVLNRALSDHTLDHAEVALLAETAHTWGLTHEDIEAAHAALLGALDSALEDSADRLSAESVERLRTELRSLRQALMNDWPGSQSG